MTTAPSLELDLDQLRTTLQVRLSEIHRAPAVIDSIAPVAEDRAEGELKHIGYGKPLLVRFHVGAEPKAVVFRTQGSNWFGHDRRSDRAALALLAADTYAEIPDHVAVIDVGALTADETLVPLTGTGEVYLLTSYVEGELYAKDLRRIERTGQATQQDIDRARALAQWIARLHQDPVEPTPELYQRALRDLIGSGEGIFGIVDSYPDDGPVPRARLEAIEQQCLAWRHRLRVRHPRLRRTHGDFHPYNILFREGVDFSVLDASRGGRGDPADDVAAMGINYLLGGALAPGSWQHGLRPLYRAFFDTYVEVSHDESVLQVIPPWLAWRLLVVASPVWYPDVPAPTRDALLTVAERALASGRLDLDEAEGTILGGG